MSVLLTYTASSGRVYNLKTKGLIRTRAANYHKWNWGVDGTALQFGVRVADFTRDAATYNSTLVFDGPLSERKTLVENLHEDFELDVRKKTPGRITWGDYYIDCYITISSTYPDANNVWTDNEITIYCPHPFWIKEETRVFYPQEAPEDERFLDYTFDYEYDYYFGSPGVATWNTDFPFESEFIMTVFGPVSNPRVLVNGYPYQFNDTLEEMEYVVIDSRSNTIMKHLANGQAVSIFDLRNKEQSIFEPMPAGTMTVNWTGLFGFNITLFEERSEPRWKTSS